MSFANTLSDAQRKRARIHAYASTWFGCISEVMLDSSAIIILFLTMLGGSETLTMFSTSLSGIVFMFMMIPCAGFVDRFGLKRSVTLACSMGCIGYLLMASAPFFGMELAQYVVLAGCLIYCISRPIYGATWYPLLDNFLLPSDRAVFFGFMRFSYMILSGVIFFLAGLAMGKEPPVWLMQVFIAAAGLCVLGRKFFVDKFPLESQSPATYDLKKALGISIKNGPLIGFSIYVCCLTAANCSIIPLAFIYLKKQLGLGDNVVQIISAIGIGGTICGYFVFGKLLKFLSMKRLQIMTHIAYILIPLALFFSGSNIGGYVYVIAALLFIGNFFCACFYCSFSTEMLALAHPGNKTMAAAFCQTYYYIGTAGGRLSTSIMLGSGILMPIWSKWNISFCKFQSLFLIYAALAAFFLILLLGLPSVVPEHKDYYEPR